jgi:hypothetical protein
MPGDPLAQFITAEENQPADLTFLKPQLYNGILTDSGSKQCSIF